MASVSPGELFKRAEEAIQRSRKLCAATRRLSAEVRNRFAMVEEADRQLEAVLYSTREARAAAKHVASQREMFPKTALQADTIRALNAWENWRRSLQPPGRKDSQRDALP